MARLELQRWGAPYDNMESVLGPVKVKLSTGKDLLQWGPPSAIAGDAACGIVTKKMRQCLGELLKCLPGRELYGGVRSAEGKPAGRGRSRFGLLLPLWAGWVLPLM